MAICRQCGDTFEYGAGERSLLAKFASVAGASVPPPSKCPLCRLQRRMVFRGELNLYKRKSALSGKDIITFYPPESSCCVLSEQEFWSDEWDSRDYGRDFDFTRPFFEQFGELLRTAPVIALTNDNNENSPYVNCTANSRNCYLLAGANHNEDCYYGNYLNRCRSCVDCSFLADCELCYECVDCSNCYNLHYARRCHTCYDSYFLEDCRGCRDCFGCVNLQQKRYCFFNKQLSPEEYRKTIASLQLQRRSAVRALAGQFSRHSQMFPRKYMTGERNENVSGNNISASRNSFDCFDASGIEDCRYCVWLHNSRDCQDVFAWGYAAELCYESVEVGDNSYGVLFSVTAFGCSNILYSYCTMRSSNCFGCVGLKRNEYCILNKQYSKQEYFELRSKIISHMKATGEWGEFFSPQLSLLPYNVAISDDYFPLNETEAALFGASWHPDDSAPAGDGMEQLPDELPGADAEQYADRLYRCEKSGAFHKIIRPELQFYLRNGIPLPDRGWKQRHKDRLARRTPPQLWQRSCSDCRVPLASSYPPHGTESVLCEACYLKRRA